MHHENYMVKLEQLIGIVQIKLSSLLAPLMKLQVEYQNVKAVKLEIFYQDL